MEVEEDDVAEGTGESSWQGDESMSFGETAPRAKRAVAQPQRIEAGPEVLCHTYQQVRDYSLRWQGRSARLCYFLPENWSPSYKFTVFEDSYVLQFVPTSADGASSSSLQYHLARPTQTVMGTDGSQLAEFELVWPVPLDVTLMDAVQHACDRVKPGTKRKPHDTSMSAVHLKLRKLGL